LVGNDLKSMFLIKDNMICAVNGHSMALPDLIIPEYNEKLGSNRRYLVHETYSRWLPAILKKGLSRVGRNNVHLSMATGRAGLQRRRKPNLGIYIDITKAKLHGLRFLHCTNDVIMCPGDQMGVISPYFFHEIGNATTGELVEIERPAAPVPVVELPGRVVEEISLAPPEGATGFAQVSAVLLTKEMASIESKSENIPKVIPEEYFKDRLLTIHGLDNVLT